MNFVVFAYCKFEKYDRSRKYLMREAWKRGDWGMYVGVTDKYIYYTLSPDEKETRLPKKEGFQKVKKILAEQKAKGDLSVVLNAFVLARVKDLPQVFMTHPGWLRLFDVRDYLPYGTEGLRKLERIVKERLTNLLYPDVVLLSAGMKDYYPNAFHLNNASNVARQPGCRGPFNGKICVLSRIDVRTDPQLIEDILKEEVAEVHLYGVVSVTGRRTGEDIERLEKTYPHFRTFGEYRPDDLGAILKNYQVGLAPYRVNHVMTKYVNPDRYFHFLNAGMETLSTDIPQARRMEDVLHIVKGPEDVRRIVGNLDAHRKNPGNLDEIHNWHVRYLELRRHCHDLATRKGWQGSWAENAGTN